MSKHVTTIGLRGPSLLYVLLKVWLRVVAFWAEKYEEDEEKPYNVLIYTLKVHAFFTVKE